MGTGGLTMTSRRSPNDRLTNGSITQAIKPLTPAQEAQRQRLHQAIRLLEEEKDLSPKEIAQKVNVFPCQLRYQLEGKYAVSELHVWRLGNAFKEDVDAEWILQGHVKPCPHCGSLISPSIFD
jgi:hypothetical protein